MLQNNHNVDQPYFDNTQPQNHHQHHVETHYASNNNMMNNNIYNKMETGNSLSNNNNDDDFFMEFGNLSEEMSSLTDEDLGGMLADPNKFRMLSEALQFSPTSILGGNGTADQNSLQHGAVANHMYSSTCNTVDETIIKNDSEFIRNVDNGGEQQRNSLNINDNNNSKLCRNNNLVDANVSVGDDLQQQQLLFEAQQIQTTNMQQPPTQQLSQQQQSAQQQQQQPQQTTTPTLPPIVISPGDVDNISIQLEKNQQCACKDCGKLFNSVWYLKQHAVKHSNDRPFKCKFCMKTYKFRSNLYQHKCPERNRHFGGQSLLSFRKRLYMRGSTYTEFYSKAMSKNGNLQGAHSKGAQDVMAADAGKNVSMEMETVGKMASTPRQQRGGQRGNVDALISPSAPTSGNFNSSITSDLQSPINVFTDGRVQNANIQSESGDIFLYSNNNEQQQLQQDRVYGMSVNNSANNTCIGINNGGNNSNVVGVNENLGHYNSGNNNSTLNYINNMEGSIDETTRLQRNFVLIDDNFGNQQITHPASSYYNNSMSHGMNVSTPSSSAYMSPNMPLMPLMSQMNCGECCFGGPPLGDPFMIGESMTDLDSLITSGNGCLRMTPLEQDYIDSYIQKNKNKVYPCRKCKLSFPSREYLDRHIAYHNAIECEPYVCDQCPQRFSSDKLLQSHFLQHAENSPHKCPQCFGIFRSALALRRHKDQCRQCYCPPFGIYPKLMISPSAPLDPYGFVESEDEIERSNAHFLQQCQNNSNHNNNNNNNNSGNGNFFADPMTTSTTTARHGAITDSSLSSDSGLSSTTHSMNISPNGTEMMDEDVHFHNSNVISTKLATVHEQSETKLNNKGIEEEDEDEEEDDNDKRKTMVSSNYPNPHVYYREDELRNQNSTSSSKYGGDYDETDSGFRSRLDSIATAAESYSPPASSASSASSSSSSSSSSFSGNRGFNAGHMVTERHALSGTTMESDVTSVFQSPGIYHHRTMQTFSSQSLEQTSYLSNFDLDTHEYIDDEDDVVHGAIDDGSHAVTIEFQRLTINRLSVHPKGRHIARKSLNLLPDINELDVEMLQNSISHFALISIVRLSIVK